MTRGPDTLPRFDITLDGAPLPAALAAALTGVRVQQRLSQPALCELVFELGDDDPAGASVAPGGRLDVVERGVAPLFRGRLSAVAQRHDAQRGRTMRWRAYDALHALRNRQQLRVHVDVTALDLARELAAGLVDAVSADDAGPVWQHLLQTGTDFDLLVDVAARAGLHLVLHDGRLGLLTLAGDGRPAQPLRLRENLLEVEVERNAHGQADEVRVLAWDPRRGVDFAGAAGSARSARQVARTPRAEEVDGRGDRHRVGLPCQDPSQAEAAAQAEIDRRHAGAVTLRGVAEGNAQLRPGTVVQLAGVGAAEQGLHVLSGVTHTVDPARGYLSELTSELPPRPVPAGSAGVGTAMATGRVTRLDDPDRLGRVQVALAGWDGLQTDWLQVLSPGAGATKGLVALPDVGDLVLLLLDAADPAQAVVLGGLYGDRGLPSGHDALGADGCFAFGTAGGQRVRLDDGRRTVSLETADGHRLEMTPDGLTLHAAGMLKIEAPGQRMLLRASQIDFDRA